MLNVTKKYSEFGGGPQNPTRLIIHSMGEVIDTEERDYPADEWLNHLKLSAHFLIKPDGEVIKMRHTKTKAWHAKGHNTDTVGIEFLVPGLHTYVTFLEAINTPWVSSEQFEAGVELSKGIIDYFHISVNNVLRHSDIDPGRKKDPGHGFDWDEFRNRLT